MKEFKKDFTGLNDGKKLDKVSTVYLVDKKTKEILFILHKKFNLWLPPGGHVEANETLLHCAYREVLEEVGVKIDELNPLFPTTDVVVQKTPFFVQVENLGDHFHENFSYVVEINREEYTFESPEFLPIKWINIFENDIEKIDTFPNIKMHLNILKKMLSL